MGDCRIRILIAKNLLATTRNSAANNDDDEWHAKAHVASADATVRDVYNATLKPLWNQETLPENVCLWDCTLYPPKDITEWLTQFGDTKGKKSKTLYDAGWFPSGTWQVLPRGMQPKKARNYDDVQYNLQSQSTLVSSSAVQIVGDETGMTPSQVLQSVTERFPETNEDEERKRALQARKQKRKETQAKEAKRHARLEEKIRQLGSAKKANQAVSQQVRRMLIKSRCTGSSSLKMHDRVYLNIVLVQGDDTKEEFRYFSQQDTVARIVAAVANTSLPQEAELLVRHTSNGGQSVYRRLPVTMRLYEAIAEKYLEEVDAVVIRCFTPPEEEPTTSITETEEEQSDTELQVDEVTDVVVDDENEKAASVSSAVSDAAMETDAPDDRDVYDRMFKAIVAMDNAASAKSKKKASSTSAKVRSMLMKSKAKGDKKRVPKMDDRFFLELVVVEDYTGQECVASMSPVFLARSDPVERVWRDCVSVPSGCTAAIYVPMEQGGSFLPVPSDISLQDAEAKGFVRCFDRAVVRLFK